MLILRFCTVLVLSILVSACGERREIVLEHVSVESRGWDTLDVRTSFLSVSDFGQAAPISPDTVAITIFDSNFDTLYAGGQGRIPFSDKQTADNERILIEVCGSFGFFQTCDQAIHYASPKRATISVDVTYPRGEDYSRGSYLLEYELERKMLGEDTWENVIDPPGLELVLKARVEGAQADAIEIPTRIGRGEFHLSRVAGFKDFQYELMSQLVDSSEAVIVFAVHESGQEAKLGDVRKTIVAKSNQTRELEVGLFVEEAGRRLLNELKTFNVGTERYVYLNSWSYLTGQKKYVIQMDLAWRSSFIRSRWFEISGQMEIDGDGRNATFTIQDGNSRGTRRWRNRFEASSVIIGDLQPEIQ